MNKYENYTDKRIRELHGRIRKVGKIKKFIKLMIKFNAYWC